jgi:hypothetical protein
MTYIKSGRDASSDEEREGKEFKTQEDTYKEKKEAKLKSTLVEGTGIKSWGRLTVHPVHGPALLEQKVDVSPCNRCNLIYTAAWHTA